ncbi:hypothetical protein HG535_0G00480 [Zygotorulaspora mrakii]|uniref:Asparaginase n=1 Tax=Zygotorulaspora mrakii TaxID=42260 RepID=A0A7H9B6N4_ZYGMR|nr:uncharacterized protein HG535_0G00480 [Zygotorulaspora mrakii]QLG74163.1 hypothetical protein HG535_0G00480 [Zygotorulaspora mrakii]
MKFSSVFGVLTACATVLAGPIYKRDLPSLFSTAANSTGGVLWNSSNLSNHSNNSNGTVPGGVEPKLQVFITGGYYDIYSNQSEFESVDFVTVSNTTSSLNLTELYQLGSLVNQSLESDEYYGVVIVSSAASIESLTFFSSVVFDTDKTVVISEDVITGLWVATDPDSATRGPISIGYETGLIYSGVAATPIGITTVEGPVWFLDASKPYLVSDDSSIRSEYSNFTTVQSNLTSSPVVPVIYDGDFSPDLISSLSSSLDGLVVVVTSVAANSSTSSLSSDTLPVVYAQSSSGLGYVLDDEIPETAISAGYLTPTQAQLLLSIAIVNGVTNPDDIYDVFP